MINTQKVWEILESIKDPEIPVISLVELGVVRQVAVNEQEVRVVMTPTFAGCPALQVMKEAVQQRLAEAGAEAVQVTFSNNPPWTSDQLTEQARKKLAAFGLAPPPRHHGDLDKAMNAPAACPYCGSQDTTLKNDFGPTLCRAIYYCNHCQQPFEQFKPI